MCVCVLLDLLVTWSKAQPTGAGLALVKQWSLAELGLTGASWGLSCGWVAGTLGTGVSPFEKTIPAASTLGKK